MAKILDEYVNFVTAFTETRNIAHVWSFLTAVSALMGRTRYLPFGAKHIFPNMYTMIVGDPASRKSTAIKLVKNLCEDAGYTEFAFESGSKESYFNSLARRHQEIAESIDLSLDTSTLESQTWEPPLGETHSFICSDEFQDFIGTNNMSFISVLGDLWDRERNYKYETIKHGIISIPKPYVSILGGTTPSTFSNIFPAHAIDQGFLSRLLMVPCRGKGREYAFPPPPDKEQEGHIIEFLRHILGNTPHEVTRTDGATKILEEIYSEWRSPFDSRFAGYAGRRHTHLLKLCLLFTAFYDTTEITEDILIEAHTLLMYTELMMPDVIGEMGKGPHATAMNLVMNTLSTRKDGLGLTDLYKLLYREVRSMDELDSILNLLRAAERIVTDARAVNHALPAQVEIPKALEKFIDKSYLGVIQEEVDYMS